VVAFLLVAASAGFASLLAPCVLPAIPLTIGYFGGRRRTTGSVPTVEVTLFALGIVGTFTGLGLLLSIVVGASGINRLAGNPWLNLFVAAVFVASALNLLNVFSFRMPGRLVDETDRVAQHAPRLVAPLLMGVAFTLATLACTAPFVGPLLVAASAGAWTRPLAGMLVYSAAFALPFVALAVSPAWVERVPRSRRWTGDLRIAIAAVQLAVALHFIANAGFAWRWPLLGRSFVLGAWIVLLVAMTVAFVARGFFYGSRRLPHSRLIAAAIPLVVAVWFASALSNSVSGNAASVGALEALLPRPAVGASTDGLTWIVNDLDAGLARARAHQRPVFVDFTGHSCGNCRWMESNIFTQEPVRRAFEQLVLIRLFTDGEGPVFERNQRFQEERFGTVALPLYAILSPDGETRATHVGIARDVRQFVEFLERARE
jgi:thiol:disulfide interchange protein DsbD